MAVATVALVTIPGVAAAHGSPASDGIDAGFAVVVGLPVVAGLAGGAVALGRGRHERSIATGHVGRPFGFLLVALGATLVVSALPSSPVLGVAGATGGFCAALVVTHRDALVGHRCSPADLTVGAVSLHRILEGLALGALYAGGMVAGLAGAVVVAGHAALETAAVGGLYGSYRRRSVIGVALVQVGYVVGAGVGFASSTAVPPSIQAGIAAVAGGFVLGIGVSEIGHPAVDDRAVPTP